MVDETVPMLARVAVRDGGALQLSSQECQIISNMRAMKPCAQEMLLDISEQYKRTLPAAPVKLRLLRSRT